MASRGCVRIEGLALQVLLNDNPAWKGGPVAVMRDEKPQSPVLALNREAREKGLSRGMRYASALSLVPTLRARKVESRRITEIRERIVKTLFSFTPDIEPCPFDEDSFWVSLEGMGSLFASERKWIDAVRRALAAQGFSGAIVAGFTRVGTCVVSRSRRTSLVLASPEEEHAQVIRCPVDILPLSPRARGTLRKLGIRSVGQFLGLPPHEMARRFGREAAFLRQALVSGDPLPIRTAAVNDESPKGRHLDAPVRDLDLLLPHVRELLEEEARSADSRASVISGVSLRLRTEEAEDIIELIRPAVPTLRTDVLLRLIELRLSGRQFPSGIQDVQVSSTRTTPSHGQGELFALKSRDLQAGARAFAFIRARYGNQAVSCARLHDSHLPERSFEWIPVDRPALPRPRSEPEGPAVVVRRIRHTPLPWERGRVSGATRPSPLLVSGSWWGTGAAEEPYERVYFYSHVPQGVRWHFVDRLTGSSWVQGWVD